MNRLPFIVLLLASVVRAEPKSLSDVPLVIQSEITSPETMDASPDGRTYAVGRLGDHRAGAGAGVVDIVDARTNLRLQRFSGVGQVVKVLYSPDGRFLAAMHQAGGAIQVWDIASGAPVASVDLSSNRETFAFSGDSSVIVVMAQGYGDSDKHALVWRFQTKDRPQKVKLAAVPLSSVAVDDTGTKIAGNADGGFQIVSLTGGPAVAVKDFSPTYAYFLRDGRIVGAVDSLKGPKTVSVVDTATGTASPPFTRLADCQAKVPADEPGARLCAYALTPRTRRTNESREQSYQNANRSNMYHYEVTLFPDGRQSLREGNAGEIWFFDEFTGAGDVRRKFKLSASPAVFTPRGEILVALGKERVASLWNLSTGHQVLSHNTYASEDDRSSPLIRVSPKGDWALKYGTGPQGTGLEVVPLKDPKKSIKLSDALPDTVNPGDPFSSYKKAQPCFNADETRVGVFRRNWARDANKWTKVLEVWELATGRKLARIETENESGCFFEAGKEMPTPGRPAESDPSVAVSSPDGQSKARKCESLVACIETNGVTKRTANHDRPITSVQWSGDGRFVVTQAEDNVTRVWNPATGALVASMLWTDEGWTVLTADNFYMTSSGLPKELALRFGDKAVPIQQFDFALNRPDAVIRALGGPAALADSYAQLRARRLKKNGVTEESLRSLEGLPQVKVLSSSPLVTEEKQWTFEFHATGTRPLAQLNVSVNGIAAFGTKGVDLKGEKDVNRKLTVALSLPPWDGGSSYNLITISAVDVDGRESIPEAFDVSSIAAYEKPTIYAAAIGVSKYKDSALDLRFAAKDAKDVTALMAHATDRKYGPIAAVKSMLVTDEQATRENILKVRDFLSKAGPNDIALVFLAGHGLLDEKLDYYFATYDIDPDHPDARGLPYAELDSLVDGIPARRRVVLMDTCHAGELDKDDVVSGEQRALPHGKISARGLKVIKRKDTVSAAESQLAADDLFADLRRRSGATIVGSSSGVEFALESPTWNNGVFTYALREAFYEGRASPGAGDVRLQNLLDYLTLRVQNLTGGQQNPSVRQGSSESYRLHPGIELPRNAKKDLPKW